MQKEASDQQWDTIRTITGRKLSEKDINKDLVLCPCWDKEEFKMEVKKVGDIFESIELFDVNKQELLASTALTMEQFVDKTMLPFHILSEVVLINGKTTKTIMYENVYKEFNDVQDFCMKMLGGNTSMAGNLLYQGLCKHIKETGTVYHNLLLASLSTGICKRRAKLLLSWITSLKSSVKTIFDERVKISRLEALLCERDEKILEVDNKNARLTALLRKRDDSLRELSSALSGLNTAMCGYLGE